MFLHRPLFAGKHAHDQLARIMRVLGSPTTQTLQELSVELKRPDLIEQECGFLPSKTFSEVCIDTIGPALIPRFHICALSSHSLWLNCVAFIINIKGTTDDRT